MAFFPEALSKCSCTMHFSDKSDKDKISRMKMLWWVHWKYKGIAFLITDHSYFLTEILLWPKINVTFQRDLQEIVCWKLEELIETETVQCYQPFFLKYYQKMYFYPTNTTKFSLYLISNWSFWLKLCKSYRIFVSLQRSLKLCNKWFPYANPCKLDLCACWNLFPVQEIGPVVPCVDEPSENTSCIIKIYHTSISVLLFHFAFISVRPFSTIQQK